MTYRFHLVCPKCNKLSDTTQAHKTPEPQVSCGDCLMDHVEVVGMKVVKVEGKETKPVTKRGTKAALKARDDRLNRLFSEYCSGITIPIMATVKIMEFGRTLYATGISEVEMGKAMRRYTESFAVK